MPTRVRGSPARRSPRCSTPSGLRSVWTGKAAELIASLSNGCGRASSKKKSTCLPTTRRAKSPLLKRDFAFYNARRPIRHFATAALISPRKALDNNPYLHNYGGMKKSDAIAALAALAQETRLDIFRLLVEAGSGGLPAGQIGARLGLPSATLSFHLSQLKHAGLVTFRRESRSLIYAAEYDAMNGLLAYLTENCCQGDPAGCGVGVCDSSASVITNEGASRHETPARPRNR
jgi:ArsR family transcriptional regulator, arsenate/arsenite/antimonite-responsive transcriptional repressor